MPDSDNFSRELGNDIDALPTEGSEVISNVVPSADISGATTHATEAIQKEAAKSVEESAALGASDESVVAVNQEPVLRVDAIQEDQSDEDEESEEEILNRLVGFIGFYIGPFAFG